MRPRFESWHPDVKFEVEIGNEREAEQFRRNLRFGGTIFTLRKDGTKYEEHHVHTMKEVLGEQIARTD